MIAVRWLQVRAPCFGTGTIVLLASRFRRSAVQSIDRAGLASVQHWFPRGLWDVCPLNARSESQVCA
jgi:hypothetical protein